MKMMHTYLLAVTVAVALVVGSSAQSCYGRVRGPPAPAYAPSYAQPPYTPCGCEDLSSLVQLANLLGTPNTPQPKCACGSLNSGNIIEKLIDALIVTATANKNKQSQSSGSLIDLNLLQGLLGSQNKGTTTPASTATSSSTTSGSSGGLLAPVTSLVDGLL